MAGKNSVSRGLQSISFLYVSPGKESKESHGQIPWKCEDNPLMALGSGRVLIYGMLLAESS